MHGSVIHDDADAKREDINTVLLEIVLQKYSILLTVQEGLMFLSSSVLPLLFQAVQKPTAIPLKMHGYMGILARVFSLKPADIPGFHFWRKLEHYGKCD